MITKVLIANRGEIALRAIRACKELGIKSLAVYSEADLQSLPIQLADEAICIGSAPASLSYLKPDRILSAAAVCDADAVYPGYGFLSENATFAEQCTANGIKFIGPSAKTIQCMGDKVMARQMARKAGVPIIPGSDAITDERKEQYTWSSPYVQNKQLILVKNASGLKAIAELNGKAVAAQDGSSGASALEDALKELFA